MAIQIRRGNYNDFDPTRMVAGEFAVCLDNEYVYIAISPGQVIQLGTLTAIQTALAQAQADVLDAEAWAKGTRNGTEVQSTDPTYHNNAKYYSEQSVTVGVIEQTHATSSVLGYQAITTGGNDYIIKGTAYLEQTISVPANTDTTFTFTNNAITTDCCIDVWSSIYGIAPKSITTTVGQCNVVFNLSESSNLTCRIYIS